jgi:cyclophilin family peptidyl-prolyl cis-trans isomerase
MAKYNFTISVPKGTEVLTMKGELYDETPITTENFVKLATSGFYNGLTFHRVMPNFVAQGGCPQGTGVGGPGYKIDCETNAPKQMHDVGVLSMAHAGPNTGGSQFFICLSKQQTVHLNGRHTCFGKILEGIENIYKIIQGDTMNIDITKN